MPAEAATATEKAAAAKLKEHIEKSKSEKVRRQKEHMRNWRKYKKALKELEGSSSSDVNTSPSPSGSSGHSDCSHSRDGKTFRNIKRQGDNFDDRKVFSLKIGPYPGRGKSQRYWTTLCSNVSAASGNPKKAFKLMLDIENINYKELEKEEGMDTLWAKLRVLLKATSIGKFLQETELEGKRLLIDGKQINGRQLCWLPRERLKADRHQEIYKQQEVHHPVLLKDNAAAYLTALGALFLDVAMPPAAMELLFTKQIEQSEQCKKIMEEYHYAVQKGTLEPSYTCLRKEVGDHIEILKRRKIRKAWIKYQDRHWR